MAQHTNDNYQETKSGWVRKPGAPQVRRSRVNWGRLQNIADARKAVQDLRQKQNEKNKRHRDKHGG